jgi:hypothetical protein
MLHQRAHINTQTAITLVYEEVVTYCPSCGCHATFDYCGVQRFPERAAALANLPTSLHLFTCRACGSTLSHIDLDMDNGV